MKKTAAWILTLTLVLTLAACGGKETPDTSSQGASSSQSTEEDVSSQETNKPDNGSLTVVTGGLESMGEGSEMLRGGTNQNEAVLLPLNTRLTGKTTKDGGLWYAFTTGTAENATYRITTVNKTPDTDSLCLRVYDKYGAEMHSYSLHADQSGKAATQSLRLPPKITYYIYVWADKKDAIQYTLKIHGPEEPGAAGSVTVEEDPLVFETPFELNSTQVMFVADKATFLDEAAAKEALKPVAEVILAHPDHPILLAGTTATNGTQEECVDLSNRRAAAVKDLLVSAFGVPESQLQSVGLGYEADPFVRGQDRDANGKFVESEGAKNRRVIVMDANDPIAQELLSA